MAQVVEHTKSTQPVDQVKPGLLDESALECGDGPDWSERRLGLVV
jgi:hypothetical protein